MEDDTKLALREGQFVAQTISAVKRAVASSGEYMGRTFDYSKSIATQLLADELGGNCFSSFIVCMNPSHSPVVNYKLLGILKDLRNMVLYPVKNDANVHALFSFLRVCRKTLLTLFYIVSSAHAARVYLEQGSAKSSYVGHGFDQSWCLTLLI